MPAAGEVLETGEGQLLAEPATGEIGVDGDDVDLAQLLIGRIGRVGLGPAEAGQPAVELVESKAVRIEPWFLFAGSDHLGGPVTLFVVRGERPVVDGEERRFVASWHERPGGDRDGLAGGQAIDASAAAHDRG